MEVKRGIRALNTSWQHCVKTPWLLYMLISRDRKKTYCGISNHFPRRFRQHLGLIKKGARYTKRHRGSPVGPNNLPWEVLCVVSGWSTPKRVRQVEWRMHKPSKDRTLFTEWQRAKEVEFPELGKKLKRRAGVDWRLARLLFFLERCSEKEKQELQVTWFLPEPFRHEMWGSSDKPELAQTFLDMSVFDAVRKEYAIKSCSNQ